MGLAPTPFWHLEQRFDRCTLLPSTGNILDDILILKKNQIGKICNNSHNPLLKFNL